MSVETPLTDLCIVSDKSRSPPGYTVISRAHDDPSYDTDLWKDSLFSFSRIYRYICISHSPPSNSLVCNVVADIALVNDKDFVPTGYMPLEYTVDSKEKALRKKVLCVKTVPREFAVDAVSDFIILVRQKAPPHGYTKAGDLEGLMLCYKYSVIPADFPFKSSDISGNSSSVCPNLPYPIHPLSYGKTNGADSQHSTPTRRAPSPPVAASAYGSGSPVSSTVHRQLSVVSVLSGIEGLPFELNSKVRSSQNQHTLPKIKTITANDFDYDFSLENAVLVQTLG